MSNASQFIASRLRQFRSLAGLSQEQAAVLVGVTFKYYQRLESGKVLGIRISTIEKVTHAYDLDLETFFSSRKLTMGIIRALPPPHRKRQRRVSAKKL